MASVIRKVRFPSSVTNTIAVPFRAGHSVCLVLGVVICQVGTVSSPSGGSLWKGNDTASGTQHTGICVEFWSRIAPWFFVTLPRKMGHGFGLSVEDTGSYSLPPSRTPNSSQAFSWTFSLFRVCPLSFSIPHTTFGRQMSTALFILKLNSTLTLRANTHCNVLYYHIGTTLKQSLLALRENYCPTGRHKLGVGVGDAGCVREGHTAASGPCPLEEESRLLAVSVHLTWTTGLPFPLHTQGE